MILRGLKKLNFYFEFFEKNSILPLYEGVKNKTNDKFYLNENIDKISKNTNHIAIVDFIPPYLDLKINKKRTPYGTFQVKLRTGFIIDLSQYSNADDYLKLHLGTKNRKNILNRLKRLEYCFDINYKNYHGEIDKSDYDSLFDEFERMIRNRFKQREEEHFGLKRWNEYKRNVYELILKKKASLLVIYDDNKPIVISLNYHFDNILDSAITSYDIDYAKFGLGNIAVLKKLEWCFQNNYKRLDMRWGELHYKQLWCNTIEEYKCDVVYNKNNLMYLLFAFAVSKGLILKKIFEEYKILPIKLKYLLRDRAKNKSNNKVINVPIFRIHDLQEPQLSDSISPIDLREKKYKFLLNPLYNYQYKHMEHTRDIIIYRDNNEKMSYIIKGKLKSQKIILTPSY